MSWQVPVSPAQRFQLAGLVRHAGHTVKGGAGRTFRRFMRAFGADTVLRIGMEHQGVNGRLANSHTPRLHTVTPDDVDVLIALYEDPKVERTGTQEMLLGELVDLVQDLRHGAEYSPPADVVPFDPKSENWIPSSSDYDAACRELAEALDGLSAEQIRELTDHADAYAAQNTSEEAPATS